MAYILQRGQDYCCLDGRNKIHKTRDIGSATRFKDIRKAYDLLYAARKKLKGFKAVGLDADMVVAGKGSTKRRVFTEPERSAVYNRYKGRCGICGKFVPYEVFTIDHIVPLEKGGTNAMENLQCAHGWCNYVKGDDSVKELTGKLAGIVLHQMKVQSICSGKKWIKCLMMRKVNKEKGRE